MERVAVIGAGPAGLVAARYLKSEGFEPVVFEQGGSIGGQWSGDPGHSGVWPSMRSNTSRVMTAFSDLQHPSGTPVYPTNQKVHAYLERYADQFDLTPLIRLNSAVQGISQDAAKGAWTVTAGGKEETFAKVVVATGRYNHPVIPKVPGLPSFSGSGGVAHTFGYKQPDQYRGKRVLVGGCAISALEIACDLAMLGAARVIVTQRRQRYVIPKLVAGVPVEYLAFTRFGALAGESLPMEVAAQGLKQFIVGANGNPHQVGAPQPADNISEAGIVLSQHFMPMVAEGRIECRPWIDAVDGQSVRFTDGRAEEFDAIIFGTGYELRLPFLSAEIQRTLDVDAHHIDLHKLTFHPDLPGLAFAGVFEQVGPYYPVVETQARWIAYSWSGAQAAPPREEMQAGVSAYRARRGRPQVTTMHANAIQFSRAAGVEPPLQQWPELARALLFGPLAPISFRLSGRDSLPDAAKRFAEDAATFGALTSNEFTPQQVGQLRALAGARGDAVFSEFVEKVCAPSKTAGAH